MKSHHFLLLSCAIQGSLNPSLQLAKRLIHAGAYVTCATTVNGLRQIKKLPSLDGLSFATFSDGFDDGYKPTDDKQHILSEFRRVGSQTLADLLTALSKGDRPVSFLIYTLLLPWAAEVARGMSIPSAFLCTHSATALAIYHHYFNGQNGIYDSDKTDPPSTLNFQGLPPLTSTDIPSVLLPNNSFVSFLPTLQEHIQAIEQDPDRCVLLSTFDALEPETIRALAGLNPIAIGPLIPSVLLDKTSNPSDTSFGCELFDRSIQYIEWLNSKPTRSVIYVSFGSLAVLQRHQMEEILHGLIDAGRPFLWVIRSSDKGNEGFEDMIKGKLNKKDDALIVPWCSQTEVLSHSSVGCFLTHCGWNSTMESMAAGLAVVGFPQLSDQMTNAKFIDEVWGTGVRVKVNEDGTAGREEIRRCVDVVMGGGQKGQDIKKNVKKWRDLVVEATMMGGTSDNNFKAFMEKLRSQ